VILNIDDECGILRMNTKILSKIGIQLNCCNNKKELISILVNTYSDFIMKSLSQFPKIIIFLDHILDNSSGIEVLIAVKETQSKFDIDINWVLLSSTEDINTIAQ